MRKKNGNAGPPDPIGQMIVQQEGERHRDNGAGERASGEHARSVAGLGRTVPGGRLTGRLNRFDGGHRS